MTEKQVFNKFLGFVNFNKVAANYVNCSANAYKH